MISVIIPTLNEEKRIGQIIQFLKSISIVGEIIIIDDGSTDDTFNLAKRSGAKVYLSSMLGKGASMGDGLGRAQYEDILFLDGDIYGFSNDLVEKMVEPLLNNEADFVKGKFSRAAGRVTALTARPLLKNFFPELTSFEQPLGGIVAGKKDFLTKVRLENDYGVDIGLLIDIHQLGARILEVEIGHVEHDHQPLEALSKMSFQIVRTILDRASRYRKLHPIHLKDSQELERVSGFQYGTLMGRIDATKPLALFDMDGTLIEGSYVEHLAHYSGKRDELKGLLGNLTLDPIYRTEMIAKVLSGIPKHTFEKIAKTIPLKPHAQEAIVALRKKGVQVGIITDSYFVASEVIKKRVFADFSIAHLLDFRKGVATGDIMISPLMQLEGGCLKHSVCKSNFITHLKNYFGGFAGKIHSVGNGLNDICLFSRSHQGYAIYPQSKEVTTAANRELRSLRDVVQYV